MSLTSVFPVRDATLLLGLCRYISHFPELHGDKINYVKFVEQSLPQFATFHDRICGQLSAHFSDGSIFPGKAQAAARETSMQKTAGLVGGFPQNVRLFDCIQCHPAVNPSPGRHFLSGGRSCSMSASRIQSSLLSAISWLERLRPTTNPVLHCPIRPGLRGRHSGPAELCSGPFV